MKEQEYLSLTPTQKILYRELFKKDCYSFVKEFWDTCEAKTFVDGKLVQFYCELFQYLCRNWVGYEGTEKEVILPQVSEEYNIIDVRQDKLKANINIPPSHSKSSVLNVLCCTWLFTVAPVQAASVSHNSKLSGEMNIKRQKVLGSAKYKFFFSEIEIVKDTAESIKDSRSAELYSVSRDSMTGFHADVIVNDDLTNARTATKDKTEMANAWEYYRDTMPSRLSDITSGVVLNIQQRLARGDITGKILEDPKLAAQYIFVVLPAIFNKKTYLVCPISGDVFIFNVGDPLWPERFGDYEALKISVGQRVWNTQYLQNPFDDDSAIITEDMINEEDCTEVKGWDVSDGCVNMLEVDRMYAAHDFPFKKTEKSDFLGSVQAYKIKKKVYLFDALEERQNFRDSKRYVQKLEVDYPGIVQVIETKANGEAIIDELIDDVPGMQGFDPGVDSKTERLEFASTYMPSIVFVRTKWDPILKKYVLSDNLQKLKDQLLSFPAVIHDDLTDSFSMLILYIFADSKYEVYGKSFNELNLIESKKEIYDYHTIFFNKIADTWKVLDIAIIQDLNSKIIALREIQFTASIEQGMKYLKEFAPDQNVFINCSASDELSTYYTEDVIIEKYEAGEMETSVGKLNVAFGDKKVLIDSNCKKTISDLENFKYSKKDPKKYRNNEDGFVSCIRVAMRYYGGI